MRFDSISAVRGDSLSSTESEGNKDIELEEWQDGVRQKKEQN